MNWLLLGVLAILIINALIGLKVGFIKMAFSLCSMIAALILTVWVSPIVNDLMSENVKVYDYIAEKVEKILPFEDGEEATNHNGQVSYIEELPLPQSIKDSLIENNNSDSYRELATESFSGYIRNYLTSIIINALAFVVTFVAILIMLWILSIALNIISKLPILNQINKLAGLVAGLVQGLVIIWVFFIILTIFGSTEYGEIALQMIEENMVLSALFDNNMLFGFITSATKIIF